MRQLGWPADERLERIAELRARRRREIAAAPDTRALEALRIAYLGRKADCRSSCAASPSCRPQQRAAVGSRPTRRASRSSALIEARAAELAARELDTRLVDGPHRRHAARRAGVPAAATCT